MSVVRANPHHLTEIKLLLQAAYYRYVDMGLEDLPNLIQRGPAAVGEENGRLWGMVGAQIEERPVTMPAGAPTRAHLRAVAFQHNHPPNGELARLLDVARSQAIGYPDPIQYLCYGADYWLSTALAGAGFDEVEAVQFFQLDRLRSRLHDLPGRPSTELCFAAVEPDDLDVLAAMDAETFDPLWHFGRRDLFELLLRGHMQVAWAGDEIAGYSAICANSRSEGQLARLAVHPRFQGRGIGRALLVEAIRYAAGEFSVLVLNTQTTNERAQLLYRSFGFRPLGTPIPVLGRVVA
jgi:ribosomal protein S18 acetylase RimI-like enzyme